MASKGITKIKIPVKPTGLTIEAVEPYLATIFDQFELNATQIRQDYDKYCLDHKILTKLRAHDDTEINNIVLVPNLNAVIEWKTGYICGNPIKYAQSENNNTDDIKFLNKYVRSANQRTVDKEVATWVYATGVGFYFIEPKSEDFDINEEAPYEVYCRPADTCAKIYSSFGGNKALFDMLYTTYDEIVDGKVKTVKVLDIYLPDTMYTYEKREFKNWEYKDKQERGLYRKLPLVEKKANTNGIGIVALGETMQNAIDHLLSNGLDNVEDIVNEVWVYYNILLGDTPEKQAEAHRKMKKGGAIQAIPKNKELQPKIDTLTPKLSLTELKELFATVNGVFHSAIGVPMEFSDTNSGGTTKQGSEVANGYENAYNRALTEINTLIQADREVLERIMWICKNTVGNRIESISVSDIEIKYDINLTDNILTKSQAYGTFIQTMPPAMALRMCRLSNDPEAEGAQIVEYMAKKQEETKEQSKKTPVEE